MPFDLIKKMLNEPGSLAMKQNQFGNFRGRQTFLFAFKIRNETVLKM